MRWQTGAEAFLEAYATRPDGLGWKAAFFDESLDISEPDESGPLTIHMGDWPEVGQVFSKDESERFERHVRPQIERDEGMKNWASAYVFATK